MDELLSEFLTETNENIGLLDQEVVQLEQNPNNPDLLAVNMRPDPVVEALYSLICVNVL